MSNENDFLEAAKQHYEALMAGNEAGWRETLSSIAKSGSRPEQWWKLGRAMVENQGVRYELKEKQPSLLRGRIVAAVGGRSCSSRKALARC